MEDVYRMYVNDIFRYLYRLTRDVGQAEDLTQETFFRAYLALDDYRSEKVRPWLFKVAYHAFVDWHRRRIKSPLQLTGWLPEQADRHAQDPQDALVSKEQMDTAILYLESLPELQRQCVVLSAMHLSYAEIAEVLAVETTDVKRALFRGRQKLRKIKERDRDDE